MARWGNHYIQITHWSVETGMNTKWQAVCTVVRWIRHVISLFTDDTSDVLFYRRQWAGLNTVAEWHHTWMHCVFLLSMSSALQLSPDVLAHTGRLCDKAAMLGPATKETPCMNDMTSMKMHKWPSKIQHLRFWQQSCWDSSLVASCHWASGCWHCVTGQVVAGCSEHKEQLTQ